MFHQIPKTKLRILDHILSSNFLNSTVILDSKMGEYYELNEVGTFIWEQLKSKESTIEEIKELVLHQFDAEETIVLSDINKILNEFVKEKLVQIN